MKKNVVKDKSFCFALKIINLCKYLQADKKEFILSKQLVRSGTAIGALICESTHAESKADFIHKTAIAQKETHETEYWIELLFQSNYLNEDEYKSVITDIMELKKILASISITSKEKYGKKLIHHS
ncbi:MAG: four helix bundle protein [Bacteroidales bacterium]|nr:four helix bundle protein [Bacteroidales bacterium]